MENQFETFEDILKANGETSEQFAEKTKGMDADTVGFEKCKRIAFAFNGGKHVKSGYYPWFKRVSGGVGLRFYGCGFDHDGAVLASRLLFNTRSLCEQAAEQFTPEYAEMIDG